MSIMIRGSKICRDEQHVLPVGKNEVQYDWEAYQDDQNFLNEIAVINNPDIHDEDDDTIKKRKEPTADAYDNYLNMEIALPCGEDDKINVCKSETKSN
jgi:hypothetical protein